MSLAGCSEDKQAPSPHKAETTPTPSPTPTYTKKQIEDSLLKESDLGKKWTQNEVRVVEFQKGDLRGCSLSSIDLPGTPEIVTRKYNEPDSKRYGANYAQLVAIYPDAAQASAAFEKVRKKVLSCPPKKSVPIKHLPDRKFLYPHEDTWKVTESEISGWKHIRGLEKAVYPSYMSIINVYHTPIDYALKGNAIFSSLYWQRTTPKESGEPIKEKASEFLEKQLNRFG